MITLSIDRNKLNLELDKIHNENIIINLPISIEKNIYNEHLSNFFQFITKTIFSISTTCKCSCIQLDVGDILNRHNWYYRYCEQYMFKKKINKEEQIPKKIRESFYKKAYIAGQKQGENWLKENISYINQLIPKEYKLNKDFQIKDGITILYKGDKNNPKIEYISHKYWLEHKKYKKIKKQLEEICATDDSVVDRSIKYTSKNFYNLVKESIKYKELFIKQSYKYLFDETISATIMSNQHNCLEFYCGNEIPPIQALRGRKAQKSIIIKKYLDKDLEGIKNRKFIPIQLK